MLLHRYCRACFFTRLWIKNFFVVNTNSQTRGDAKLFLPFLNTEFLRLSRINELATWNNLQLQYLSFLFQSWCRLKRLLFIILQPLRQPHLQWRSLCTRWSSARESEPSNTTVSPHICVQESYVYSLVHCHVSCQTGLPERPGLGWWDIHVKNYSILSIYLSLSINLHACFGVLQLRCLSC